MSLTILGYLPMFSGPRLIGEFYLTTKNNL